MNKEFVPLRKQEYDKPNYPSFDPHGIYEIYQGIGDDTLSIVYEYKQNSIEPTIHKLPFRCRYYRGLAGILVVPPNWDGVSKYESSKYRYEQGYNPIIKAARGIYSFREDYISNIATKLYAQLQKKSFPEEHKIVAALLAAPFSAIENHEKKKTVDAIKWALDENMFPDHYEWGAMLKLAKAITSYSEPLIVSHAGKYFSEKVLWHDDGSEEGIWRSFSELERTLVHPIKGSKKVEKVYFPTREDINFERWGTREEMTWQTYYKKHKSLP